jgi:hypothetical protein
VRESTTTPDTGYFRFWAGRAAQTALKRKRVKILKPLIFSCQKVGSYFFADFLKVWAGTWWSIKDDPESSGVRSPKK